MLAILKFFVEKLVYMKFGKSYLTANPLIILLPAQARRKSSQQKAAEPPAYTV